MFLSISATFIMCFYCLKITAGRDNGNNILNMWVEGETCPHPSGLSGTCRHVSQCPEAMSVIEKMEQIKICSFRGFYPIVCCLDRQSRSGSLHGTNLSRSLLACERYNEQFQTPIIHTILKGEDAFLGEFPHMAAIRYKSPDVELTEYKCAGTLISDHYVLTAAHCIADKQMGTLSKVRLGGLSLSSRNEGAIEYPVEKTYVHPKYVKGGVYNDIGLLRLSEKVKFKKTIMPACLLNEDMIPENLTISGWGSTDSLGMRFPNTLMKTTVKLVDSRECNKSYFGSPYFESGITEDLFCVRDPKGEADTCAGDSGAPAQLRVNRFNNIYTVAGVLSLGPTPCGGATPSVYSRISRYLSWIEDIVWR